MQNKSKFISSFVIGSCLVTLVSCGSDSGGSGGGGKKGSSVSEEQQTDEGIYRAVLSPVNSALSEKINGTVEITIKGDQVIAKSSVKNSPAGVKHLQNIMTGTTCPAGTSDLNADSLVDISEAMKSSGQILIPLDSDISDQLNGMSYGPIANGYGSYFYQKSTSFSLLLSDLNALDPDPSDAVVKIPAGQNLNLSGRVIIIHGVRSSTDLPSSVVALGEEDASTMIPIACGKLQKVKDAGSLNQDDVPTPTDSDSNP